MTKEYQEQMKPENILRVIDEIEDKRYLAPSDISIHIGKKLSPQLLNTNDKTKGFFQKYFQSKQGG